MLSAAQGPPAPLSRSTPHLGIVALLDTAVISRAGRVRLTLEITPKRGMHVYAPGSTYRAVRVRVADGSPFALQAPVQYPKASLYTFKPLNERVLVYDAPFTLVADLGLRTGAKVGPAGAPLNATLEYQSCDDKVCFLPESVPLRWTIRLLPSSAP